MNESVDPAWLPPFALRPLGSRRVRVTGDGPLVTTVRDEVRQATAEHGGALVEDGPVDLDLVCEPDPHGDPEAFVVERSTTTTTVRATGGAGLLHGFHHVVRKGGAAFTGTWTEEVAPRQSIRMLDHWDNVDVHPVMGQVERGYSGGSLFWRAGAARRDLPRVAAYARLLAACGINAVAVNNVNVHATEARLLTDRLAEVAELAAEFRRY